MISPYRRRALRAAAVMLSSALFCLPVTGAAAQPVDGVGAAHAELPDPSGYDAAIVWLPDTQYYSESYPGHFNAQTRWIVDNADTRKLVYATHTGDIVDDHLVDRQWQNASSSMGVLEAAGFPYGVAAGNHDVALFGAIFVDYRYFQRHFGADRFAGSPVYGESYQNNRQHYDLVDVAGTEVLVLHLAWAMRTGDFDWAAQVLTAHPNTPVIIAVHEYIDTNGAYSGQGGQIFTRLVQPHDNVVAVIAGHIHGTATNVKDLGGGRQVVEMLADYQSGPEGGSAYLRLLQFDLDQNKLIVDTYSPSLDESNYFGDKDDFTVNLDLTP
ncbi:metallophosphoesterase [Actinophytocola gossypii]|uniref:Metallophosphoesterase n=1 Tax=Actinophytocola gossypii TaxID=2812003 RepID=A0ABT2J3A8_9PSEU|nr:metallophosphoesterase [Actinophytocola gossypii]MCT2582321.1 metallophosphoesterase [Actinophytocola gossypii]